jgi:MoaA/NifB/PqqE/SkfB family radical SAM enzyme
MRGNVHKDLKLAHLTYDIVQKLPIAKMNNLKRVTFRGNFGDPLMNPELDNIIDLFKKQQLHISTNASLRDVKWWSKLGSKKNIEVVFCIDGSNTTHKLYRRNTSYRKIMANAEAFISAGGNAIWQFIVFKHNEHEIHQAEKISKEMGFKRIKFMYSERFDVDSKFKVYENSEYLYDLEKSTNQTLLREKLGSKKDEKYWKKLNQNKSEVSCIWSKAKQIYIHSDGTVYPCCMIGNIQAGRNIEKLLFNKIVKDSTKINLKNNSFANIIESEVFKKIFPESLKGNPLTHPICIEWCNKSTGKIANSDLNTVNT